MPHFSAAPCALSAVHAQVESTIGASYSRRELAKRCADPVPNENTTSEAVVQHRSTGHSVAHEHQNRIIGNKVHARAHVSASMEGCG